MEFEEEFFSSFCDETIDFLSRWEQICLELNEDNSKKHLEELFRIAHNIKGGSRTIGLAAYGDFMHRIEDGITLLRDGAIQVNSRSVGFLLETHSVLIDWSQQVRENREFNPELGDFWKKYAAVFKPSTLEENAESSIESSDEINSTITKETSAVNVPRETSEKVHTEISPRQKKSNTDTIRIYANKLDELIQVIGELSIHQSIIWHARGEPAHTNKMHANSLQLSQKLTKELYDKALSLRMQPLQSVFQRLERNIVGLATELGKQVGVEIVGGDVELDKTVIEKILDPLTHIVRNSMDHGIENFELREKRGKSKTGTIQIRAHQDTFGVELVIRDDGQGLRLDKIKEKALQKGLISDNKDYSPKEVYNLIFLPGFSTAEKITEVSGRGVGMDVVRRTIEDLHGTIEINSTEGQGTQFTITLPTSVSIIDAMLIKLGDHNYVVPVGAIEEVLNFELGSTENHKQMIHHNGKVLPLQNLADLLCTKSQGKANRNKLKPVSANTYNLASVMVCQVGENKIGFVIDRVLGQQQIVIRPLNENISGAFGILGGTVLGNGEPGLILDIPALVNHYVTESRFKENIA